MKRKITVNSSVPEFILPDKNGTAFDIRTVIGKHNLVIYFYPKDETAGCTAEACSFRDAFEDFLAYDCKIIGISADSAESHKNFAQKHNLPFILLSDSDNKVRNLFGVPKSLGLFPGRETYIIGKDGKVRHIFNSQTNINKHISEALKVLAADQQKVIRD
jgi:thioredoxin-dependent peroxiredoxin